MTSMRVKDDLTDMRNAAGLARSYVEGMTKVSFLTDTRTQQAVIMNLVIIGEIATKLIRNDSAFADGHPEIP
jgi:uncharacterized protein with HEPN domain